MNKPVRFLPEARAEFTEAIDWYAQRRDGLGRAFVARVREVLDRITTDPGRHRIVSTSMSVRCSSPSFREDLYEILVISVFHTSRDPSIWKSRI